jgi:hypothetical protein
LKAGVFHDPFGAVLQKRIDAVALGPLSFSDPAGIRTQDPILKRDVLYLLSYWIGVPFLQAFPYFFTGKPALFKELQI